MSEPEVDELREKVTETRITIASLMQSVEHLSASVAALTVTVQDLRDAMNQGRGALWAICGTSSVAGALLTTVISSIFGKGS